MEESPARSVQWNCEETKKLFDELGIRSFDDFWMIEEKHNAALIVDSVRHHKGRFSRKLQRHTSRIRLSAGGDFFLKRAGGSAFKSVERELSASLVIPQFGLEAPPIAAHASAPDTHRGFVLFKRLDGYYSIQELLRGEAPPETLQSFAGKKKGLYERIISVFQKVQCSHYYYPDWRDKHLFWNPATNALALIDLERFHELSQRPAYARIGPILRIARKKEQETLVKALGIKMPDLLALLEEKKD